MSDLSVWQRWARTSGLRWNMKFHYARERMYPRMSWHPDNLFNIMQRATTYQPESWRLGWNKITVQRNIAKRLVTGYHCQHITAKQLRNHYLRTPPTHRITAYARKANDDPVVQGAPFSDSNALPDVPYHTLMFAEVERRLDTVLFRACLAPSIYEARQLIRKGWVRVEEAVVRTPGFALEPGMMFSVDPKRLTWGLRLPESVDPRQTRSKTAQRLSAAELTQLGETPPPPPEEPESSADVDVDADGSEAVAEPADGSARELTIDERQRMRDHFENGELQFRLPDWAAPMVFVPAYLEVNFQACAGVYVRHPTAKPGLSEIPSPWDASKGEIFQLFYEYWRPYLRKHRIRPRMAPGLSRNPWRNETRRMRGIGTGDALAIQYLSRFNRAIRGHDDRYVNEAEGLEQKEARRKEVKTVRRRRASRYIGSRLKSTAVPLEKADQLPANRVRAPDPSDS